MANQGIIHLSFKVGGRPFCNSRRSIMSTTPDKAEGFGRTCVKCARIHKERQDKAAKQNDKQIYNAGADC